MINDEDAILAVQSLEQTVQLADKVLPLFSPSDRQELGDILGRSIRKLEKWSNAPKGEQHE